MIAGISAGLYWLDYAVGGAGVELHVELVFVWRLKCLRLVQVVKQ